MLTIIKDLGKRYLDEEKTKRYHYLLVRCHCGTEFPLEKSSRNRTKSCGCIKTFKKVGEMYGYITIIKDLGFPEEDNRHYYKVQCVCGEKFRMRGDRIVETSSCGCKSKRKALKPITIGETFGLLTVTKDLGVRTEKNRNKRCVEVKCKCGSKPKVVEWGVLKRGLTKSCGCTRNAKKVGETHGFVTILSDEGTSKLDNKRYANVKCVCGTEFPIAFSKITKATSCGCKGKNGTQKNIQAGKTFGRLTVTKDLGCRLVKGYTRHYVEVKCTCGSKPKEVLLNNLLRGITKSCGCLTNRKKLQKANPIILTIGDTFGQFTLTKDLGTRGKARTRYVEVTCSCGTPREARWYIVKNELPLPCKGCQEKQKMSG